MDLMPTPDRVVPLAIRSNVTGSDLGSDPDGRHVRAACRRRTPAQP